MTGRQRRLRVVIRWLALVCCCLGAPAALPAAPVAAAPTLTLTPERGACGQDVTLGGAQFPPGYRVTLRGPREAATNNRLVGQATYK